MKAPIVLQVNPFNLIVHGTIVSVKLPHSPIELVKTCQELSDKSKRNIGLMEVIENLFGSPSTFVAFSRAMEKQREWVN